MYVCVICCVILCCVVLWCVVLCCVVLCCVVLCCVVLCCVVCVCVFCCDSHLFRGEGSRTKIDYRKKDTLILKMATPKGGSFRTLFSFLKVVLIKHGYPNPKGRFL